jgi:hypothetical protein
VKRRLLIGLAVLVGLLVVLDVAARLLTQAATSRALASSLSLTGNPTVSISGEPFLAHLVAGSFPAITVEGQQVDSGGLRLETVHAVLRDVQVPVLSLARGNRVTVTAESGSGTATVTAAEITRVFQRRGTGVTVEFDQGHVRVQVPGTPAFINATVGVESGRLVLHSSVLGQQLSVDLPQVIPNIRFTSVRVGRDRAVLGFQLRNATFQVGG